MPHEVTQPAIRASDDPDDARPAIPKPGAPVRIVGVSLPLDDVLALVFMILLAQLVIAVAVGGGVGIVWFVAAGG